MLDVGKLLFGRATGLTSFATATGGGAAARGGRRGGGYLRGVGRFEGRREGRLRFVAARGFLRCRNSPACEGGQDTHSAEGARVGEKLRARHRGLCRSLDSVLLEGFPGHPLGRGVDTLITHLRPRICQKLRPRLGVDCPRTVCRALFEGVRRGIPSHIARNPFTRLSLPSPEKIAEQQKQHCDAASGTDGDGKFEASEAATL